MRKSRFLIMARVGDTSLHGQWIQGASRNFDLYLSYYGDRPGRYKEDADYYREMKSTKWPALYAHIGADREIIESYDAIWFPDDDLLINTESINRMFDLFSTFNLSLAQPALTFDSYFSHSAVLRNPSYILRFVNFVEVMAPIFSKKALELLSPTFSQVSVGWGLDFVWPHLLQKEGASSRVAIIDQTPVTHTRPIGGGDIYKNNLNAGENDFETLSKLYPLLDINTKSQRSNFKIFGGVRIFEYGNGFIAKFRGRLHRIWAKQIAKLSKKHKT